jgi:predicted nucleic-acid-binding Zn-ribbon protein
MNMPSKEKTRLLRCGQCGEFYPARSPEKEKLVPSGGSPGGTCKRCGSGEFERVTFASSN